MIDKKKKCKSFEKCEENAEVVNEWHIAGLGDTVERTWRCCLCGRQWREVYLFSCMIDEEDEELIKEAI